MNDMSSSWKSSLQEGSSVLLSSSRHSATNSSSSHTTTSGHNLLTFLAVAQFYGVDILPVTWEFALDSAAPSGTAKIYESSLDVNRNFVFKRTRIANPSYGDSQDIGNENKTYNALVSEISILHHSLLCQHPFIVKMHGISWEISKSGDAVWPVIVLEKAQLGDLDYFMTTEAGRDLSIEKKVHFCTDIASAILALHRCSMFTRIASCYLYD